MDATPITMTPIGQVCTDDAGQYLQVAPAYRAGLAGLADFGHVYALWWAARYDMPEARGLLTVPLPYADGREVGVFACRAPVRPNLIMETLCEVLGVDEATGTVRVGAIDAFDGTPLVDLKPYYGCTDRVREPKEPGYLAGWDAWFPAGGTTLMPGEE